MMPWPGAPARSPNWPAPACGRSGTTTRSGCSPEPERRANGYKQYGVAHLVRLLRIKRLVDLGFSLSQIAAMGDDDDHPAEALRALDAELAATIERLQRARIELGVILRHHAPTDLPPDFAPAAGAAGLSEADRSLLLVMTPGDGARAHQAYAEMLRTAPADPTDGEFDSLPADADERTRQDLAERMAPHIRRIRGRVPGGDGARHRRPARRAVRHGDRGRRRCRSSTTPRSATSWRIDALPET